MRGMGVLRESFVWLAYRVRNGRWVREKIKVTNKAGEGWGLIVKVLECMLRRLDLLFSVDTGRICTYKQRNVMQNEG